MLYRSNSPSSQYLQPEFTDPRCPTPDSTQSPLVLLMQTCNNIGKDAPVKAKPALTKPKPTIPEAKKSPLYSPVANPGKPRRCSVSHASPIKALGSPRKGRSSLSPQSHMSPQPTPPAVPSPTCVALPPSPLALLQAQQLESALAGYHSALLAATSAVSKLNPPAAPEQQADCKDPFCPTCRVQASRLTELSACSQPAICNWVCEGGPCGQRFASTDDLIAHVRTHTTEARVSPLPARPAPLPSLPLQSIGAAPINQQLALLALQQLYDPMLLDSSRHRRPHPYMRPELSSLSMLALHHSVKHAPRI